MYTGDDGFDLEIMGFEPMASHMQSGRAATAPNPHSDLLTSTEAAGYEP
jgi:hypothetical protein